ncbi:uncharacterized protein [Watersipora subatra]|uniref:uncharacterized protein n=1 Tax=Watersipora subatra TaxID=2589382 RepID=UPI00355B8BED
MSHPPLDSDDESGPPLGKKYTFETEVEEHAPSPYSNKECRYKRPKEPQTIRRSGCMGSMTFKKFTLTRECVCLKYTPGEWENHYSKLCKWRRITDQVTKKVYLVRKCVCEKPPGV